MSDNPPAISPALTARVKNILLRPTPEWGVIRNEPTTITGLFTGYAMILAAIGPIAGLIGGQIFGVGLFSISTKPDIVMVIVGAILEYVLALAAIYVIGLLIDALAPSFGAEKNPVRAMKVAVYSWTAAWLAGIFGLIPMLSILGILGLYSLYLLYLGLQEVMGASKDKALGYTAVVIVAVIVIYIIVSAIVGLAIGGAFLGAAGAVGAFN